ncbi:hypothetical protein [Nannocystis bainbridge]|uniref:Uncharacterized protein n=1 Tax=Nannocystis bainbridge TaxID=2995303 RepID=A0ABT5DTW4_9BACT|nr:hypothetical protein [Nannocystis bainbridge]MDC0716163.1 hypothetical protein [Nannocystis bainbridge]
MYDAAYQLSGATQLETGAATALPGKIWYFYRGPRSGSDATVVVWRTTFDATFVDAEAFTNPDAWAAPIEVTVPSLAGYREAVAAGETPAGDPILGAQGLFALTVGPRIYLFWVDATGALLGTRSAGEDLWEPAFRIAGASVATGVAHAVTGYVFKDRIVLGWMSNVDHDCNLYFNSFAPDAIAPAASGSGQVWPGELANPSYTLELPLAVTGQASLSAAWTVLPCVVDAQGAPIGMTGRGTNSSAPVVFVAVDWTSARMLCTWFLDITSGVPTTTSYTGSATLPSTELLPMLDLDASNTMYVYSSNTASQLQRAPLMQADGSYQVGALTVVEADGTPVPSKYAPQVVYAAGSPRQAQLATSADPGATVLDTVATDLYRMTFTNRTASGSVLVCIQFYGTRHIVTTVNELYVDDRANPDARQQALAMKGVVDGPLPVPAENLAMMSQGGTVTSWDLYKPIGRVTYGTTEQDTKTHEITVKGSFGVNTSFSIAGGIDDEWDAEAGFSLGVEVEVSKTLEKLTEMVGIKTSLSVEFAYDHIWRSGTAQANVANVIGLTRVLPSGAPSEDAPPVLSDQGYVSGSALAIVCLALVFEDPQRPGVLPARPSMVTFMPEDMVALAANYTANYAFTPGDLASYAPASVDQRMAAAYRAWQAANPGADDPFGADYENYFERVVQRRALRIGPGGRNYLEFAVTNDGVNETRVDMSSFDFQEWGTTVDSEFYAALTWDNLVNVAGLELKSYLEAGVSIGVGGGYRRNSERTEGWGISASIENFPQATRPGQVCAYTFRLYFMPADARWAQEVMCFSDYARQPANGVKPIDPGSQPWKIMFFVDPASIARLS